MICIKYYEKIKTSSRKLRENIKKSSRKLRERMAETFIKWAQRVSPPGTAVVHVEFGKSKRKYRKKLLKKN